MDHQLLIPLLLSLLAGLATGIGSLISLSIKTFKRCYLCFALGLSAGVMIYISLVELLNEAMEGAGFVWGNISFFSGIVIMALIDYFIPHEYISERVRMDGRSKKLMAAGVFTALGIAIHNFPEGMAVMVGSLEEVSLGASLAFAIALHNIPEGIAVAMPIYYATKNRSQAFKYSLLSGLAEPVGALIAFFTLRSFINDFVLSIALGVVAGIMVFISFDELLPLSFKEGKGNIAMSGIITGMAIMALSIYLF